MTDSSGNKYEFLGVRYKTNDELLSALATHLGIPVAKFAGKAGGVITIWEGGGHSVRFTYVHEDGVDKVVAA